MYKVPLSSGKPLRFAFYANKRQHYNNRLFTFDINNEVEAFNYLYSFIINHNVIKAVYITDTYTKHNMKLPTSVVQRINIDPGYIKSIIKSLH